MKHLIASSVLVVFFLTPSLALMNISDSHPLDGSVGTQNIQINAFRGMVRIRDNNVLSEWDGFLDYKNALLVTKLFSKMACILAKIDQAAFPTLGDISNALEHQDLKHYPSTRGLTYTVLPNRVKNLAQYGMAVKDMCRDVPTYFARQHKEGTALAVDPDSCFEVQLLSFMGLSVETELSASSVESQSVLKAGKSNIQAPADSVSAGTRTKIPLQEISEMSAKIPPVSKRAFAERRSKLEVKFPAAFLRERRSIDTSF